MKIRNIVIIVLISVFIWCIVLLNGWHKEIVLFGSNIFKSWFIENQYQVYWSDDTTVKNGEFAYRLFSYITIPETVTTIEKNAFKGNKLTGIVIPPNVTYIGDKAFATNKLTNITIGSDVLLGKDSFGFGFEDAYRNNGLFGGTYTRYSTDSYEWSTWYDNFKYRKDFGNVNIIDYNGPGGNLVIPEEINGYPVKVIEKKAFYEKSFASVIIPNSVTRIEEMAFFGRWDNAKNASLGTISSVTFGNSIATIGERAFENNKLSRVTLPNSVTSIGISAFADNPITRFSIGANVTLGGKDSKGILGEGTGFNTAYFNNKSRAGVYTRPNAKSTTWTRLAR